MAKIKSVKGRQVFDSRGNHTVEAEIFLDDGSSASAISPSGASTGAFEAHELRDKDQNKFFGKGVNTAVQNINNKISNKLKNLDFNQQENIDKILLELDGSENKTNLGANATLAVSLAYAKCAAIANKKSIYNLRADMKTEKFDGTQSLKPTDGSELPDFIKSNKQKYGSWLE